MTVTVTEVPYHPDSAMIFRALADQDWPVWLDSGSGFPGHQVDVLAANPMHKLVYDPAGVSPELHVDVVPVPDIASAFEIIEATLIKNGHHQPWGPGWLGYLSYDLFDDFEAIRKHPKTELIPGIALGFYGTVIVNNHEARQTRICSLAGQEAWVKALKQQLTEPAATSPRTRRFQLDTAFSATTDQSEYRRQFRRIKEYILEGDCYQVNLTRQFSATCQGDALEAYLSLRQNHPSPMSAYFSTSDFDILSLSPERFLQRHGNRIASYPIKGTRPRSTDHGQDRQLRQDLQNSLKDRAENVMIVDLLRNDLGRVCETGSVTTPQLFDVESFPNVHHLVSTVEGTLKPGVSLQEIFHATFPGGSITGAPKVRAMEIIEELEHHRRGIYCGSMVFFCGNGDFDSNIAIRTLLKKQGHIHCWGGGGVVADSVCDNEYQETLDKVGRLMAILERAFGGEAVRHEL
ncbi:MAG: aminodeoxychorismate synthase component I [Ketobacteraceae bacterium]|nr:aminodeoxychorismate synthase component I [Ketobacteraceae bacterium]